MEKEIWLKSAKQGNKMLYTMQTRDIAVVNAAMNGIELLEALQAVHADGNEISFTTLRLVKGVLNKCMSGDAIKPMERV